MSTGSDSKNRRATVKRFLDMKASGERIAGLTAYDVLFARVLEEAGVDFILVGDSLGQVVLGYDSTLPVTMDQMIHHATAVTRGAPETFVCMDMPFLSFQVSPEEALENAGRAMKEARVQAIKLEGGGPRVFRTVQLLVEAGIPVMGHLGLTPQSVHALGGYRVQGRGDDDARRLKRDAKGLENAGAFAVVLELIPAPLAEEISASISIPTIGIGAGAGCDGQILVLYDALGLNRGFEPRFLRRFVDLHETALRGVTTYLDDVRSGTYPGPEHSFDVE